MGHTLCGCWVWLRETICSMSYTMVMVTWCCSSAVCHQNLTLKSLVAQLYVIVCPSTCFGRIFGNESL